MPGSKLAALLNQRGVVFGAAIYSSSPAVVEVAGYSGLDFIRIENEHAWRRDESAEHMIRAAHLSNITPIVRVDKGDPYIIRKALEIGAGGILVPNILSGDEVREVVRASKFPPKGIRGYSPFCFSGRWGDRDAEEWIESSDNNTLVGIMIENDEAISNLEDLLSVDGLDFALFGPADYSMSIGLGKPMNNHPKVQEAMRETIEKASKYDIPVSIGVGQPIEEEASKYISFGFRMIELGSDVTVLRATWKGMVLKTSDR